MTLIDYLAKSCYYAQQHIDCDEAWNTDPSYREELLQCTSFQVACFLAQNTVLGLDGVEWEIVLDDLSPHPAKTEKQWVKIIKKLVKEYGGLK